MIRVTVVAGTVWEITKKTFHQGQTKNVWISAKHFGMMQEKQKYQEAVVKKEKLMLRIVVVGITHKQADVKITV